MIAVWIASFVSGSILGAWVFRAVEIPISTVEHRAPARSGPTPGATSSSAFAPLLTPGVLASPSAPPIQIPPLNYDPKHAVLPDSKLTPGDTLPAVTAAEVCTPGWASEHRHVTESMRDRVYTEYGRTRGPDCCEVDHLIPLELGGSNDMKNLWPEPDAPRPGWAKRISLRTSSMRKCAPARYLLPTRSAAFRRIGSNAGRNTSYPNTGRNGPQKTATDGDQGSISPELP
jgi:hypothetical protein